MDARPKRQVGVQVQYGFNTPIKVPFNLWTTVDRLNPPEGNTTFLTFKVYVQPLESVSQSNSRKLVKNSSCQLVITCGFNSAQVTSRSLPLVASAVLLDSNIVESIGSWTLKLASWKTPIDSFGDSVLSTAFQLQLGSTQHPDIVIPLTGVLVSSDTFVSWTMYVSKQLGYSAPFFLFVALLRSDGTYSTVPVQPA